MITVVTGDTPVYRPLLGRLRSPFNSVKFNCFLQHTRLKETVATGLTSSFSTGRRLSFVRIKGIRRNSCFPNASLFVVLDFSLLLIVRLPLHREDRTVRHDINKRQTQQRGGNNDRRWKK
eukprot:gb/GECG01014639.1/.p1 GENE.gb/GECG01014639.1/~~gb/GECG01014639.1/.p1  ORF type:complete len:120 (+),score=4.22 gb/GECG01014639.1/:1-360(+)